MASFPRLRKLGTIALFVGASCFSLPLKTDAATVEEYFNGYGTSSINLVGLNGGSGWSNAWQSTGNVSYSPGTQISYSGTGYSSTGNLSGAGDGRATGSATAGLEYRNFTGMTGTIWASFVTIQSSSGDVLFWLDKTDTVTSGATRNFVALRGTTGATGSVPEPLIAYSGADDFANNTPLALNTAHLSLIKIDMNFSSTLDRISFWVDPDLSGGEAGLGATVGSINGPAYVKGTADAFGTTFGGIGLSFSSASNFADAIRLSNDANGFLFVTVPEPTPFTLIGGAFGIWLVRRRREHS